MRILHAPTNIAGQPYVLSRALRRLGHRSDVLVSEPHPFGYPEDRVLNFERLPPPWRQVRKVAALARLIASYDVFHFYFGESILAEHRDLDFLRRTGRRTVFHFRGCEIRMRHGELAQRRFCACTDCPAPCDSDDRKALLRTLAFERTDRVLVATPDLLEWVPGAELVTQAIDVDGIGPGPPPPREQERERYVVLHAPSDRLIKGTRYVEAAIDRLQAAGYPIELRLMHGRPHTEVREALAEADIVVDQLLMGWYANFSIEAMASGRPVIAYIREDLKRVAGYEPPILSANPETIDAALIRLIDDAALRRELGEAGPPYVKRIHDSMRIARQLEEVYRGGPV